MRVIRILYIILLFLLVSACANTNNRQSLDKNIKQDELLEFAKVNCMFWYFKKLDYDLKDIRAISGGIVELGTYSADTYQKIALLTKEYTPKISTKQNIDIDLLKCFKFDSDSVFKGKLNTLK